MAFDPICGDGTAHAIREAILASAVIRALAKGGSQNDLLSHYEARLTAGFQRHLAQCRQFYLSGGTGPLWTSELEAIDRGLQWCSAKRWQVTELPLSVARLRIGSGALNSFIARREQGCRGVAGGGVAHELLWYRASGVLVVHRLGGPVAIGILVSPQPCQRRDSTGSGGLSPACSRANAAKAVA